MFEVLTGSLFQGRVGAIRPGASQESREKAQSMSPGTVMADTWQLRKGREGSDDEAEECSEWWR